MDLQICKKDWAQYTGVQRRGAILEFESACKAAEAVAKVTIEPTIYSACGVYAREIFIPKGTALVGEIHLTDQINVVSKGKIRVATEEGVKTVVAPCTFISKAGTKRAGFALEDTIWTAFLGTEKTEDADIYAEFIAKDYETLDKQLENKDGIRNISSSSSGSS